MGEMVDNVEITEAQIWKIQYEMLQQKYETLLTAYSDLFMAVGKCHELIKDYQESLRKKDAN